VRPAKSKGPPTATARLPRNSGSREPESTGSMREAHLWRIFPAILVGASCDDDQVAEVPAQDQTHDEGIESDGDGQ